MRNGISAIQPSSIQLALWDVGISATPSEATGQVFGYEAALRPSGLFPVPEPEVRVTVAQSVPGFPCVSQDLSILAISCPILKLPSGGISMPRSWRKPVIFEA